MQYQIACFLTRPQNLQTFAEACTRFSPQIALRDLGGSEQEAVFIDFTKTQHLFSPAGLKARLDALARKFEIKDYRIAIATTPNIALARARFGVSNDLAQLESIARPFTRDSDADKKIAKLRDVLAKLGIKTLTSFLSIPPSTLASHLGSMAEEALALAKLARGETDGLAWPGFHPTPLISEKVSLADVATQTGDVDFESMIFVMRGILDRALSRLRGRCERASIVQIKVELDRWSTLQIHERKWIVTLPLPQGSTQGLLPIIKERLNYELGKLPLEAPIQSLQVEILESAPGAGAQKNFFHQKEEEQEAWNSLVGRIGERLGISHVFVAVPVESYLPEKSYARQIQAPATAQHFFGHFPERPTRLLSEPEPLHIRDQECSTRQKRWRIRLWKGPEKIKMEAWKNVASRDYFQVLAENGEKLWVYFSNQNFFLHGYFD